MIECIRLSHLYNSPKMRKFRQKKLSIFVRHSTHQIAGGSASFARKQFPRLSFGRRTNKLVGQSTAVSTMSSYLCRPNVCRSIAFRPEDAAPFWVRSCKTLFGVILTNLRNYLRNLCQISYIRSGPTYWSCNLYRQRLLVRHILVGLRQKLFCNIRSLALGFLV